MKTNNIVEYLDELIKEPKCELNYSKDYELLIAVMLSAQTKDSKVNEVTKVLFTKYPTLEALKDIDIEDAKLIIKPLGNFTSKALSIKEIANKVYLNGSKVPNDRTFLESIKGVGRKTANVVLLELYNEQVMAVDTHVTRVCKRLNIVKKDDDSLKIEEVISKNFKQYDLAKLHHQFVLFGRYYCKSRNPKCENCKLKKYCIYK